MRTTTKQRLPYIIGALCGIVLLGVNLGAIMVNPPGAASSWILVVVGLISAGLSIAQVLAMQRRDQG